MILRQPLTQAFIFSVILHLIILIGAQKKWTFFDINQLAESQPHRLNIRQVGIEEAKERNLIFVPDQVASPQAKPAPPQKKKISFSEMAVPFDSVSTQQAARQRPTKVRTIKELNISEKEMQEMIQSSPLNHIPPNAQRAFRKSDVAIKLDVPKGIPEDELNKHEMVFYSFQKRIVLAYVNSFYNELNEFELKNPHLDFPMIKEPEQIAGRITYDKNGDILSIKTLKWTSVDKLQDFFMGVLKNMSSLPNPPKEILDKDSFAINFVLTLNK